MEFRPCIDIHNGSVKQIVGGSLCDCKDEAAENYVSEQDAAYYANLYKFHRRTMRRRKIRRLRLSELIRADCRQAAA